MPKRPRQKRCAFCRSHGIRTADRNWSAKPKVSALSEFGRPNRVVVIEEWPDLSSPSVAQAEILLAAKVQSDTQAPIDRRVNLPMSDALAEMSFSTFRSTAFFVLMHIDVRVDNDEAAKILQAQRDAVISAPGALGCEVTVQDHRNNHFTISEVWKNRTAYETYTATRPAQDFRRSLAPLIGAPFDDRFYERIKNELRRTIKQSADNRGSSWGKPLQANRRIETICAAAGSLDS